jgi:hypothetical protein
MESNYFVECVTKRKKPINGGEAGLWVVKLLAACDKSLKQDGKMVRL